MTAMDYDIVIVGAGVSGLYSGWQLKDAGLNVLVLEGRDRIAGRQWTYRAPDLGYTDMGAAYVGKTQTKILEVLKSLDIGTYKVYNEQKSALSLKSGKQLYNSGIPSFKNPLILLDINNALRKLDNMSKQVPTECPWEAAEAEKWDSMSVQQFFNSIIWTKEGMAMSKAAILGPFLIEPSRMSLLYLLHEIKMCGGMTALITISNGLQEYKILGGSSLLSDKLAEKLEGCIQLNKYVTNITEIEGGVQVTAVDGTTYTAKKVIVTVPLPAITNIQFTPELPQYMQKLSSVKPEGHCIKTFTFYETAFWREHGLNGELLSEDGVVTYAVDDTKPDGTHPAIMGFVMGDKGLKYSALSVDERKKLISEQYASDYGLDEFLAPINYTEKYWQDEEVHKYSNGCCVWSLPPGVLTDVRKLPSPKQPCGNVYFTGTESALTFRGYMDGALRSAQCVSAQVCSSLGKDISYNEAEFSADVPYIELGTLEKYLPNVPVFIAVVVILAVVVVAVIIGLILYFTLS